MRIHRYALDFKADRDFVRIPFLADGQSVVGVSCALSVRSAGDMGLGADGDSINPNRIAFFSSLGIPPQRVLARTQVHSLDVALAEGGEKSLPPGDGIAVADPLTFASVTVADCLPIFLLDRDSGAFAALHSGWKGTGIALRALRAMGIRWGTKPSSVSAVFGPCIRGCCYAVDEGRAAVFEADFGPGGRWIAGSGTDSFPLGPVVHRDGRGVRIDLQAANARLLETAGVADLSVCDDCTFTDERLGSFRREGAGRFTRMAAVVGWLPEENR